jgi:thiopurine S-methyltransferase
MTDSSYWQGRWTRGETGWHESEVPTHLQALLGDLPPTRVFVPLCGKSRALAWFAAQGHEVVGVELSEVACRAFFAEQGVEPQVSRTGDFLVLSAPQITLYCGDFFALRPEHLGDIGAVYDRAALIALPRPVRARYAHHLTTLARPRRFVQVLFEREPPDDEGPPFSVSRDELAALYGDAFAIEWISRGPVPGRPATFEHVAVLTPR